MTLVSKHLMPLILAIAGSMVLAACSSTPSPWSESSSPWDNRAQGEPEPMEIEAVEPMGITAMEENASEADSEYPADEPIAMIEPEPEPMPIVEENTMSIAGGLASQPPGNYAVQVVASSSMDQLTFFASQNQLSDEWIAETTVDGKIWYVLMLGVYESKSEAEQALASVQDMDTQPWIRTIGSLQAVMN